MKKLVVISLIAASVAFAGQGEYQTELTITGGFGVPEGNLDLENSLNLGLRMGNYVDSKLFDMLEFGYERAGNVDYKNSTQDTTVNRFFVNFIKEYDINKDAALYALVGAGYEDYSNVQFKNDSEGFVNYGVGFKQWVTDSVAIKYELRHAINTDGDNNLLTSIGFVIPFNKKEAPALVVEKVEPKPMPLVVKEEPKPMPAEKVEPPRDDDKDGVINQNDACLQTPMGRVVNDNGCMKVVELRVNFDTNKYEVPVSYTTILQEVSDFMNDNDSYKVSLEGHTDSVGTMKYNQGLSQRRAASVKDALIKLGVENSKITTKGYGETKPIVSNDTVEGRTENRRVEAHFSK